MNSRRYSIRLCNLVYLTALILSATAATAATAAPGVLSPPPPVEKVVVADGSVVHNVGLLGSNVTNWGLIGSAPASASTFSDAPSAQWPLGSGIEYLYSAGLWVGGIVLGEQLVTTGGILSEFLPSEDLSDTIYATAHGAIGGNRFPWPDADDDGDGLEDEELLNGLDDDDDGLVDEDFAAIGDQHFVCRYNDFEPTLLENNPEHTPLNVEVVQQSIQWSSPLADDFIGYEFTITNVGVTEIEQVYLGLFSDFDIGPRFNIVAENDYAGFVSTMVQASNGSQVPVQAAYMYDGAGDYPVDGYAAWVLCGHTTDPLGASAPAEVGVSSFQKFSGQAAFAQGGDPTNDAERYELLSRNEWDANANPGAEADYRVLTSSGPFPSLAPGESISYQVALVLGAGLDEMVANAAEAVAAYRGVDYDRDGDPANGDEVTVHWLLEEDAPVPARTGWIMAQVVPGGVELLIETNMGHAVGLSVLRQASRGVQERSWRASDLRPAGSSEDNNLYRLLDTDPEGWPRVYNLVLEDSGYSQSLDQVDLEMPQVGIVELSASPNPFNPMVNIRFNLDRSGPMLLQAFDLRGRLVRTLVDEYRAMGADTIVWRGDDDTGRALASGVYQLRLSTEGRLVEERVTLVR